VTSDALTRQFDQYLADRNVSAARLACVLVAILMPAGILLDVFTQPDHALDFLILRLGASVLSLACLGFTYAAWAKGRALWLGSMPAFIAAGAIQLMIEQIEGYASPYYAGLNLCILGIGLVFHWKAREAAVVCTIIVCFWVTPALLGPRELQFGPFFNNLYFLILTSLVAVGSNAIRYSLARREYDAQHKLAAATVELSAALDCLRELNRTQSQFFANVSHELRTPLTLILAPVEALIVSSSDSSDDKQRSQLEVIQRNAGRLLRLIDELLELSQLDAGGLRLNVATIDLCALTTSLCERAQPMAENSSIELSLTIPPTVVTNLYGDAHRLEIVLTNLVGNALKYTEEGGRVEVRIIDRAESVTVEVEDTGKGISQQDLPRVFDRFFRASPDDDRDASADRRQRGGVGIGMALAKELTELHGGKLEVKSELGVGSTFTLILPKGRDHFRPEVLERRRPTTSEAGDQGPTLVTTDSITERLRINPQRYRTESDRFIASDAGLRQTVLVAEDQHELRKFIKSLLAESYDVIEARSGEQALQHCRTRAIDLVLSDIMMPGMSGTELCETIKSDPVLRTTPVILLTAKVGSAATIDAYAHGADDFVAKPFHPRVLLARVQAHLRIRALSVQVVSREKLAAVGTLAAGVAHEVKNPLNALLSAAQHLLDTGAEDAVQAKLLNIITDGARRIEGVVSALESHARPADAERPVLYDVREGIEATLRLLDHRMRHVRVHRDFAGDPTALVSPGPLNQVILNLLENAIRSGANNVWLSTGDRDGQCSIAVADDGPGIPEAVRAKIFDAFFTTRPPGEGTGLGLYVSSRIVTDLGGHLSFRPRPGGGAWFQVDLPRHSLTQGAELNRPHPAALPPA
jgi:signal transduction histidine kinase